MTFEELLMHLHVHLCTHQVTGIYANNLYFDKETLKKVVNDFAKRAPLMAAKGEKFNPLENFAVMVLLNTISVDNYKDKQNESN